MCQASFANVPMMRRSWKTYRSDLMAERLKQWAGMAPRSLRGWVSI